MTDGGAPALRWRARWLAVGWILVAAIVIGSLAPLGARGGLAGLDKLEHFFGYALLMFWFAALHEPARRVWFAVAFVALGAALEVAQGATGWRSMDARDLLADALGVAVGWAVAHRYGVAAFRHAERAAR
jgi:hypothetical protein